MWLGVVAVTFFQLLTLLSWSNWEPKRGHARRGKRGRRGGRRGEKLQSYSHKMMRNLEENKTEMGANKMMMDESSPLATLGEHIAKLSSLGKANGYGKCKDRLQQKYLCSWSRSRLYTLPYRPLPCRTYIHVCTLHILSTRTDGDGPSLSPTRHDIPPVFNLGSSG